jgi:GAF domain-containing protein
VVSGIFTGSLSDVLRSRARLLLRNTTKVFGFEEQRVYYGLVLAYGLLFILPSLGFINFAYKYGFFTDNHIRYYFLFVLVFSYLGFFILRSHADRVRNISESIEQSISGNRTGSRVDQTSELNRIVASFQQLLDRLEENNQKVELKAAQLRCLVELADSSSDSIDTNLLLELGLQQACRGVGAGRGWLLMLDESRRHHFTVICEVATNGSSQNRLGAQIPFAASKAKQAVLQQSPVFLADSIWQERSTESGKELSQDNGPALVIPLQTSGDYFGVICLEDKEKSVPFSHSDLDFVLPLAASLSYRYENLQFQNLIDFQAEQINCLSTINKVCTMGLLRGKVFQLAVKELRGLMPVKIAFLALFDATQEYLELLEVASEEPIALRRGTRLPFRQSLFNLVAEENREIHRKEVSDMLHPLEARWFQELGVDSCYLASFRNQGINAGILFVGSDSEKGFSGPHQLILQHVGECLGLTIHNQLLLQQINEQGRELDALNRIGEVVASSLFDLDGVMDKVGQQVDQLIKVEAGVIYLREENMLVPRKTFGTGGDRIEPDNLPCNKGICGYVTSRGESVLIRDVSQNPHLSSIAKGFGGADTRSILCVPLVVGEKVVGSIHMWNKEDESFTAHDEKVMKSVAASLAAAVVSSKLYSLGQRLARTEK